MRLGSSFSKLDYEGFYRKVKFSFHLTMLLYPKIELVYSNARWHSLVEPWRVLPLLEESFWRSTTVSLDDTVLCWPCTCGLVLLYHQGISALHLEKFEVSESQFLQSLEQHDHLSCVDTRNVADCQCTCRFLLTNDDADSVYW